MDFRDDRAAELREVHGVKHFLAPEDEKVLESAISFYQGAYTMGVTGDGDRGPPGKDGAGARRGAGGP